MLASRLTDTPTHIKQPIHHKLSKKRCWVCLVKYYVYRALSNELCQSAPPRTTYRYSGTYRQCDAVCPVSPY